uniref:Ig-like domain-containing protein n=1 Tax=Xiphophorus maculatus TaxID=8083 RepID=A0A3B5R066_XIPMA
MVNNYIFTILAVNSLVPVITVELGQTVTLTCAFSLKYQNKWIFWYKQSPGDTLDLIVMQQGMTNPNYGPAFSSSKFTTNDGIIRNLTILRTIQQDEGMYHCALIGWTESTWTGTYLMVKGRYIVSGLNHFNTLTIQKHCNRSFNDQLKLIVHLSAACIFLYFDVFLCFRYLCVHACVRGCACMCAHFVHAHTETSSNDQPTENVMWFVSDTVY